MKSIAAYCWDFRCYSNINILDCQIEYFTNKLCCSETYFTEFSDLSSPRKFHVLWGYSDNHTLPPLLHVLMCRGTCCSTCINMRGYIQVIASMNLLQREIFTTWLSFQKKEKDSIILLESCAKCLFLQMSFIVLWFICFFPPLKYIFQGLFKDWTWVFNVSRCSKVGETVKITETIRNRRFFNSHPRVLLLYHYLLTECWSYLFSQGQL